MESEGKWMVIRRRAGRVVEESTVFVPVRVKPRRNKRKGTTTAQKQDENERDRVKRLARVLNCNYAHGDLMLTPKYNEAGMKRLEDWAREHEGEFEQWEDAMMAAAEREGGNYLRRLERALKKAGVEVVKYVLITSDMDGDTGEAVRLHHHLIIPRIGFEAAAAKWGLGTVDYQILRDQDDYTPLAEYLMRQVRRRPDAKKYTVSRNMETPVVNERWAKPGEELRPDRGCKILDRNQWEPGKAQYIRFAVPRNGENPSITRFAGDGSPARGAKTPAGGTGDEGRRHGVMPPYRESGDGGSKGGSRPGRKPTAAGSPASQASVEADLDAGAIQLPRAGVSAQAQRSGLCGEFSDTARRTPACATSDCNSRPSGKRGGRGSGA